MPLIKGKSKKSFEKNMETEMEAGKPKDQSLAIAYSMQRKAKKKMAAGGIVEDSPAMDSMAAEQVKEEMPEHEDHYDSIADAILRKKKDSEAPKSTLAGDPDGEVESFEDLNEDAGEEESMGVEDPLRNIDLVDELRSRIKARRKM